MQSAATKTTALPAHPHARGRYFVQHLWNLARYWQLYPLWRFVTRIEPSVVLPTRTCDRLCAVVAPRILALLLRRRVKEIMDARRRIGVLPPPTPPHVILYAIPGHATASVSETPVTPPHMPSAAILHHYATSEAYYLVGIVINQHGPLPANLFHPDTYPDQLRYVVALSRALRRMLRAASLRR